MKDLNSVINNILQNPITRRKFLKANTLAAASTVQPNFIIPSNYIKELYSTDKNGTKTNGFMPGDDVIYNLLIEKPYIIALLMGNVDYGSSKDNLNPIFNLFGQEGTEHSWQSTIPANASQAKAQLGGMFDFIFKDSRTHNIDLKQHSIDNAYITDENGNEQSSYSPGQIIKINSEIIIPETTLPRDLKVGGQVTYPVGTFDLEEQVKNSLQPGTHTVIIPETIPSNTSEGAANIDLRASVNGNEKYKTINFIITEAFLLQGKVEDIHGNAIKDLEITINEDTIYTDADGNYSAKLKKGDYVLSIPHETYYNFAKKVNISGNSTDNLIQMFKRQTFHFEEADVDLLDALKILTGTDNCDVHGIDPLECTSMFGHWEIDSKEENAINIFLNREDAEKYIVKYLERPDLYPTPEEFVGAVKQGIFDWETKTNDFAPNNKKFKFFKFYDEIVNGLDGISVDYSGYDKYGRPVPSGRFLWKDNDNILKNGTIYLSPLHRPTDTIRRTTEHEQGRGLNLTNPRLDQLDTNPLYKVMHINSIMGGAREITNLDAKVNYVFHSLKNYTLAGSYTK